MISGRKPAAIAAEKQGLKTDDDSIKRSRTGEELLGRNEGERGGEQRKK